MERNGAARSRGPLGSPSASSNKTGPPATPGSWIQAANWIPRTPARGTDPGLSPSCTRLPRTAQPTLLEPMTDDGPVCPPILPGLGGGGAPSPRSRDASMPALSKNREPNPASVFHRHPPPHQTKPKPPDPQLNKGCPLGVNDTVSPLQPPSPPAYPPACAATAPVGAVDRPPSGLPWYVPPPPLPYPSYAAAPR